MECLAGKGVGEWYGGMIFMHGLIFGIARYMLGLGVWRLFRNSKCLLSPLV